MNRTVTVTTRRRNYATTNKQRGIRPVLFPS